VLISRGGESRESSPRARPEQQPSAFNFPQIKVACGHLPEDDFRQDVLGNRGDIIGENTISQYFLYIWTHKIVNNHLE